MKEDLKINTIFVLVNIKFLKVKSGKRVDFNILMLNYISNLFTTSSSSTDPSAQIPTDQKQPDKERDQVDNKQNNQIVSEERPQADRWMNTNNQQIIQQHSTPSQNQQSVTNDNHISRGMNRNNEGDIDGIINNSFQLQNRQSLDETARNKEVQFDCMDINQHQLLSSNLIAQPKVMPQTIWGDNGITKIITPEGRQIIVNYQENTIISQKAPSAIVAQSPNIFSMEITNMNAPSAANKNAEQESTSISSAPSKAIFNSQSQSTLSKLEFKDEGAGVYNSGECSYNSLPHQVDRTNNQSYLKSHQSMINQVNIKQLQQAVLDNNQQYKYKMKKHKANKHQQQNNQTMGKSGKQVSKDGTSNSASNRDDSDNTLSIQDNTQQVPSESMSNNTISQSSGGKVQSLAANSSKSKNTGKSSQNLNQDQITGVLKRKINKNNKRTKEVSLTLNHNNLQQLVQMLQAHTNQDRLDRLSTATSSSTQSQESAKINKGEFDSNQQALNLIMQLITNNVNTNKDGTATINTAGGIGGPPSGSNNDSNPRIDPQLIEQLFCIDHEEEECSDSDEDDDDDENNCDSSNEDDEEQDDMDEMEADDDEPVDEEDMMDDEDEYGDDEDQYDQEEYGDECDDEEDLLYDDEEEIIHDEHDDEFQIKQSNNDNRIDLLQFDNAKQAQSALNSKENLQNVPKQQLKKGVSHSQKQFAEDAYSTGQVTNGQNCGQDGVALECGEQFFNNDANSQIQNGQNRTQFGRYTQDATTVDGENSSQLDDICDMNEAQTSSFDPDDTDNTGTGSSPSDGNSKLLKHKLKISDKLSPQFHRFYENFSQNVNFIIQYEYNILPQQKNYQNYQNQGNQQFLQDQRARDAAQLILKKKYNNLRKLSEQNCKNFTGPHSVLQIFIEKIVQAIESFACKLKSLTRDELQLWLESDSEDGQKEEKNLNELNYSINGIDLNLIFKMLNTTNSDAQESTKDASKTNDSQQQDSQVQKTLKYIEQNTKSPEAKEKLRQLGRMTDNQIEQLVQKASDYLKQKQSSQKFKPLLKNLPNYTQFLQNVICHYNLIIKQYAPNISRHFTEMTSVIKEGNKYEFPSQDIHRTILDKLIINDNTLFKPFFQHIRQEYVKHEKAIKKKINQAQSIQNQTEGTGAGSQTLSKTMQNYIKFDEVFESFIKDVETDINKGVKSLNIDFYMRDLRKHAIKEYNEVFEIEQALLLNSDKNGKTGPEQKPAAPNVSDSQPIDLQQLDPKQIHDYSEKLNQRYGFIISSQSYQDQSLNQIENDNMQQEIFDFNMLDSKEKKKLKKKQRKRDKKIKQQMAQHGLLPPSEASQVQQQQETAQASPNQQSSNENNIEQVFQSANDTGTKTSSASNTQTQQKKQQQVQQPCAHQYCKHCNQVHQSYPSPTDGSWNDTSTNQEKNTDKSESLQSQQQSNSAGSRKKKGKNGGKLSHEQIRNLTTEEIVSYIENEGKNVKNQNDKQIIKDGKEGNNMQDTPQLNPSLAESNKIQQMRAKAKAFVAQQKQAPAQHSQPSQSNQKQKAVDPNNFTCKFCNGSIDQQTLKFVHENFCLVGNNSNSQIQGQDRKQTQGSTKRGNQKQLENSSSKVKNQEQLNNPITNNGDTSTQASGSLTRGVGGQQDESNNLQANDEFDEDQKIEEFAKKLEAIQKWPSRYIGSGAQRRRRKLKPNISKDWVNKLRKQLKSQQNSIQNFGDKSILGLEGASNSSESGGSYASSSNSNDKNMRASSTQYNSEAKFQKKRGRLSDLTAEQIQIEAQNHPESQSRKDPKNANAAAHAASSSNATANLEMNFDGITFNPTKLNLSLSASQNRKKIQAANSKGQK